MLAFYHSSSSAFYSKSCLCVFLPFKVLLCFHFHFRLSSQPLGFARVCSGRRGGGVETRHIIRRALIGCRFSPDTAVIVFCRGSSGLWYEICAIEWSSTVLHIPSVRVSANDGVNKQRDYRRAGKKQGSDPGVIISEWSGVKVSLWTRH